VFFCVFAAPHCAGHHFWRYMEQPGDAPGGLSETIEQVYRAVDREIGEMIDLVGPDARVLVASGHGMGALCHASWNLPDILDLLGYGRRAARAAHANRKATVNPWRVLRLMLPGPLQYAIRNALPRRMQDRLLFLWYAGGRKFEGRRAFAVPNNESVGAIRISVKGRDRDGIVEPGPEYRAVCEDLASALSELTDPVTGRRVVRRVTLLADEFHGPYLQRLPDITVLWDQSFLWRSVESPRFGRLDIPRQDGRSGSHTPHGFALAVGRGIAANTELAGRSIYDIAATVLDCAGVPIPAHVDGKPFPSTQVMAA
jgi:predicted AlkP superfamily phosphohydrolase/phosphomutase